MKYKNFNNVNPPLDLHGRIQQKQWHLQRVRKTGTQHDMWKWLKQVGFWSEYQDLLSSGFSYYQMLYYLKFYNVYLRFIYIYLFIYNTKRHFIYEDIPEIHLLMLHLSVS